MERRGPTSLRRFLDLTAACRLLSRAMGWLRPQMRRICGGEPPNAFFKQV